MRSIMIVCLLYVLAGLVGLIPRCVQTSFEQYEEQKAARDLEVENEKARRTYEAIANASK